MEKLKLDKKQRFINDLKQAGASNDYAIEDLLARASFHATEFQGENRSYIKNSDGKIVDSRTLVDSLKEQLPSYFTGYVGSTDSAGNVDAETSATLPEYYVLNLLNQIEEGKVQTLDDAQKATLKRVFSELNTPDMTPGAPRKRLGKYEAMHVHRLFVKAGGLK